ncbi:LysM peptidoglycan-binding domain-containing protein [Bacillus sp. BRMEA1]|uniref:LysM peptidoglycan-binding and 3D domain-containing protein n=1 Tax=Neobacillus endophyticus TaxID=2738405 RepID=UPI001563C7C4|nr:3D domain-containing protein [Neobacillus endophyticus]NRD80410.1 LysM peptidoglycan-binding domain-containing protein [Neobacillus endophyticus]
MISKLKTIIAVAALSVSVGANVHAEEITVKKGDTLWGLSKVHNTTVQSLKNWNQLSSDLIHPGDILEIPERKQYTVKQNDTLWGIAHHFGVTIDQIRDWNTLDSDLIHPGLILVIYENTKKAEIDSQAHTTSTTEAARSYSSAPAPTSAKAIPASENQNSQTTPITAPHSDTKEITVNATAYTASCEGCSGITKIGIDIKSNPDTKVIAVDPSIIPLGSKVYVEGYGEAIAGDTGGAIKGNRIDVFIPSEHDALDWGRKQVKVKILN